MKTIKSFSLIATVSAAFISCALCAAVRAQDADAPSDVQKILNFSHGIANILKAPKIADAKPDVATEENLDASAKIPLVPINVGATARVASLSKLDAAVGEFFKQTSGESFSALAALKLTEWRAVLDSVDLNAPVSICVFFNTTPPTIACELPVSENKFRSFATALARAGKGDAPVFSDDKSTAFLTVELGDRVEIAARQIDPNYVALADKATPEILELFRTSSDSDHSVSGVGAPLKEPTITIEISPRAISDLTTPNRPFWIELERALADFKANAPEIVDVKLEDVRKYALENLASARFDVSIDDYALYFASQARAQPRSRAAAELASFWNFTPLDPNADRFFAVLPDVESAVAGQIELSKAMTDQLPKPFNRLRFVEYSFGLPTDGELAAGSWLFYLEVDDAEEFAKEMIIPKAREIGRYVGSKQASQAAAQILGGVSERRRDRQISRRVPARRLADPERASALGGALGAAIGGAIGEQAGEDSAMKEHRFNGFKMYVSDIETYVRQSALKKAEEEGRATDAGSPLFANTNASIIETLISVINGGDDLQRAMLRNANEKAAAIDDSPLIAQYGYLIILDENTILYAFGNEQLMRYAVNNYQATVKPRINYLSIVRDEDALVDLRRLVAQIPNPRDVRTVGATRLDFASAQAYYRWLRSLYFPGAPNLALPDLPQNTPKPLLVSSASNDVSEQRFVMPHKTIANLVATFSGGKTALELMSTVKSHEPSQEDAQDFEVDFDDE